MAITLTSNWQDIASSEFSPSGYNVRFRVTIQARYTDVQGNSAVIQIRSGLTLISPASYTWTGTNKAVNRAFYDDWRGEETLSGSISTNQTLYGNSANSDRLSGGTTVIVKGSGRVISTSATAEGQASLPTFSTAPSGLRVSVASRTYNSISLNGSIESYGDPWDNPNRLISACIMDQNYASTAPNPPRRSPDFPLAMSFENAVVDNNSPAYGTSTLIITGNQVYTYGIWAYNGVTTNELFYRGSVTTPCPPMVSVSEEGLATQTYNTYNTVNATIDWVRNTADDAGVSTPRTGYYRYSTDNGDTYSDWIAWGNADNASGTFTAVVPTSSTVLFETKINTPWGGDSESISTTFTTLPTHTLNFSNFTYKDINPSVVNITEDDQILVQNQSTLQVTIPYADRATITDGVSATIQDYTSSFNSSSITIPYSSTADTSATYPVSATNASGTKSLSVVAHDSLETTATVNKTVEVIPWATPTITADFVRIDTQGHIKLMVDGTFSPLKVNGIVKNDIALYYVLDDGEPVVFTGTVDYDNGTYHGEIEIYDVDYGSLSYITASVLDVFDQAYADIIVSITEENRYMKSARYDVEFWNWKTNAFEMDVSHIIDGDLNISWTLNDIEEVSFTLDLVNFERHCELLGVNPVDMLDPYVHDIRIKRNGIYIVGCQLVEAHTSLTSNNDPKITVRGTGYLNLFKDQYISEPMAGYTYPKMAHKLLNRAQHADILVKNPTGDIDTSYWLARQGTLTTTTTKKTGARALQCVGPNNESWTVFGTALNCPAGTRVAYNIWIRSSQTGNIEFKQSPYITYNAATQYDIATEPIPQADTWTQYTGTYTTRTDKEYFIIGQNARCTIQVDDVFIYRVDDEDAYHNLNVGTIYGGLDDTEDGTGHNYATTDYISNRQYDYQLQNVKDAVMDLVALEDDNFDFEFTYDRKFNTYDKKGSIRTDLSLDYPGNVESLDITRSAIELINKVQNIGSGIGDERLEVFAYDNASRLRYGNRESVITNSNVSLEDTLKAQAEGLLADTKDVSRELTIEVGDGSITCGNIQTGDILPFKVGNTLLSSGYSIIGDMSGWYRVKGISQTFTQDGMERTKLTLDFETSFEGES